MGIQTWDISIRTDNVPDSVLSGIPDGEGHKEMGPKIGQVP
jgi:hypothetical protein